MNMKSFISRSASESLILFLTVIQAATGISAEPKPLVIAHRGSCGMLPEHTVEAYKLAVQQGADVIECDVAVSKDLKLLCTHESWLNLTTDVSSRVEFRNRIQTYFVPALGENVTDYFTIDFTLEELMSLKRVQVNKFRDQAYNGRYGMASFDEYIAVAKATCNPKTVRIYVETKNPAFFNKFLQKHGTNMEDMLLASLKKHGYKNASAPSFIESFSLDGLKYMSKFTTIPLVYLTKVTLPSSELKVIANYISVICPDKNLIVEVNPETNFVAEVTDFVKRARFYGLKVHAYTFRNEFQFLAYDYGTDPYREYEAFIAIGLDGMFTDFPWSLYNYIKMRNYTASIGNSLPDHVWPVMGHYSRSEM